MTGGAAALHRRIGPAGYAAAALLLVYVATLAPGVTFWDAGEFIAAAHALGIPHPPGTPLFVLLLNVWAKAWFFLPYAVATNLFSAACTALAAGLAARLVERATRSGAAAVAAALAAGGMSTVWLNATETEVYAASLALAALMLWSADCAGREAAPERARRWVLLTGYLMVLAVPLHLSALVAAPPAVALACLAPNGEIRRRRVALLAGTFVVAIGVGRMSPWLVGAGVLLMAGAGIRRGPPMAALAAVASSAVLFLYVRAQFDPAIDQGAPRTLAMLAEMVARRQYDVAPLWPRMAPAWIQLGNFGQYADWQIALSTGSNVLPSILRTLGTAAFVGLGYAGSLAHWRTDRRTWIAVMTLFVCGSLGVIVYLNLHAGPSIGYGILPENVTREARERDYFFVFAFWAWGMWAGMGAVAFVRWLARPAWTAALVAALPILLNWRAVTRRAEPEGALPFAFAESLLESTPRDGVLFVVGDNDSYPLWYAQEVRSIRPDVAVVTVPLLPTRWYREQLATRYRLFDDDVGRYDGMLATATRIADAARARGRPVAAAVTMRASERARLATRWRMTGMVYVAGSDGIDSAAAERWGSFVSRRLGSRQPRDAIDPVSTYFRRLLDCPRAVADAPAAADSTRLDSICNYR